MIASKTFPRDSHRTSSNQREWSQVQPRGLRPAQPLSRVKQLDDWDEQDDMEDDDVDGHITWRRGAKRRPQPITTAPSRRMCTEGTTVRSSFQTAGQKLVCGLKEIPSLFAWPLNHNARTQLELTCCCVRASNSSKTEAAVMVTAHLQSKPTSQPTVTVVTSQEGEVCGVGSYPLSVVATTMEGVAVPCSEAAKTIAILPTATSHCLSPHSNGMFGQQFLQCIRAVDSAPSH